MVSVEALGKGSELGVGLGGSGGDAVGPLLRLQPLPLLVRGLQHEKKSIHD